MVTNNRVIEESFSTADVDGIDSIGGFVDYNTQEATIRDSYATGNASGDWLIGGFTGQSGAMRVPRTGTLGVPGKPAMCDLGK